MLALVYLAIVTLLPGGNGVMDSAFAGCAGGPGSMPAIGIVELQYADDFSPSRSKVLGNGTRLDNLA